MDKFGRYGRAVLGKICVFLYKQNKPIDIRYGIQDFVQGEILGKSL